MNKSESIKIRAFFISLSLILLITEIYIGREAVGWVRSYLGDVLIVILIYSMIRMIFPVWLRKWYVLPTGVLLLAFGVEALQLWGFCDRFSISNKLLRIIIGTSFSVYDLICYILGILPCYLIEAVYQKYRDKAVNTDADVAEHGK